jgi:prevent-host-death family protein
VQNVATTISQRELRNDNGEIMRRLDQGETFIVTRNGMPVGALTPLRRPRFVNATAVVEAFADAPRIAAGRFRSDLAAIADQSSDPRA